MCVDGLLSVDKAGVSPPLHLIRGKALLEIIKAVLALVILFSSAITWSQTQVTDQSNPLEYAEQSPTSQSNPASAPPTDRGTVSLPDQAPAPQDKKDDSQGQQTKRMFWLVPNFAAVSAHTQLPPLSTREKFALAAQDSVEDYSSYTWAGILAGQAMLLNSDPELGSGIKVTGAIIGAPLRTACRGLFSPRPLSPFNYPQVALRS